MIEALNGRPNNRDGGKPTVTPKRDMEVREGDHLDLGDQHLIIHTAPGHTPGNLFIEGLLLKDGGQTYNGIWGGGGAGSPGLEGAKQGLLNAQKLNAIRGVQVYLMSHSWLPNASRLKTGAGCGCTRRPTRPQSRERQPRRSAWRTEESCGPHVFGPRKAYQPFLESASADTNLAYQFQAPVMRYNPSYTSSMKTAVSLPESLFVEAEAAAKKLRVSRSQLYAKAIAEFLERVHSDRVTERLNEVYAGAPAKLDAPLYRAQVKSLGENTW